MMCSGDILTLLSLFPGLLESGLAESACIGRHTFLHVPYSLPYDKNVEEEKKINFVKFSVEDPDPGSRIPDPKPIFLRAY
jgi:hypothetical protein